MDVLIIRMGRELNKTVHQPLYEILIDGDTVSVALGQEC